MLQNSKMCLKGNFRLVPYALQLYSKIYPWGTLCNVDYQKCHPMDDSVHSYRTPWMQGEKISSKPFRTISLLELKMYFLWFLCTFWLGDATLILLITLMMFVQSVRATLLFFHCLLSLFWRMCVYASFTHSFWFYLDHIPVTRDWREINISP